MGGFRGWAFKVRPITVPIYRLSPAVLDCHSSSVLPDQVGHPLQYHLGVPVIKQHGDPGIGHIG